MHPPRRLGRSLKRLLRTSMGLVTALSIMNSRSMVLRADWRLMLLLIVTRTFPPGLMSLAIGNFLEKNEPRSIANRSIAASLQRAAPGKQSERSSDADQ